MIRIALARTVSRRSSALLPKTLASRLALARRWETNHTPQAPHDEVNAASELFANDHVFDVNDHAKKHFDAIQNKKPAEQPSKVLFDDFDIESAFDENEAMEKASRLAEAAAKKQPKK